LRVALAQVEARVGDFARSLDRLVAAQADARAQGADVVVFPEMSLVGYPPRDLLFDPGFVAAAFEAAREAAKRTAGGPPCLVGGLARSPERLPHHPSLANAALLLSGGTIAHVQPKLLLPAYEVFHEPRWFIPGRASEAFEVAGRRVGALVCEDVWDEGYAAHPAADLAAQGAEALLALVASPFRVGIPRERLRAARRHRRAIAFVNAVGVRDELIFDGGSFALSADGEELARLPRFAVVVGTVDLDEPSGATPSADGEGTEEELFSALSFGVRGFVEGNGLGSVVLGLSGGVDSALVAAIAVEALGAERVLAVHIPSRFTDPRSTESAREVAAALRVRFEVRPLEPLLVPFEAELSDLLDAGPAGRRAHENVQARLRMAILAAFVNRHGGLLLNASNKTELALGYGTLWGDLAGLLSPIGDLPKTDVMRLAQWVARTRGAIPPFVLERAPTAELSAGQVDPFDYDDVAPRVEAIVANRLRAEPANEPLRAAVRRAEGKRFVHGIVLKVSEWAFGSGRLVPVTRAY
jgi:NAD+ synthase (glutamine-hydrolysing)